MSSGIDLLLGKSSFSARSSGSLSSFQHYKDTERELRSVNFNNSGFSGASDFPEYETLSLRIEPPTVTVTERDDGRATIVEVESANRAGTLCEVVQHFTELGLNVTRARISSDGGWFVDVFEVQEAAGGPVKSEEKLNSIRRMLDINFGIEQDLVTNGDDTDDSQRVETTVFELAGYDRPGLVADVAHLLTLNGCNVRSAAVWTYRSRVAIVLSVTHKGQPIQDALKLQRLQQILFDMMDRQRQGIVTIKTVRGEVHHDRRLHQLMLQEELRLYAAANEQDPLQESVSGLSGSPDSLHSDLAAAASSDSADSVPCDYRSPKHSKPDVDITYNARSGYWVVDIQCKDRQKLLFDTVCTLADMGYDVYHATIDGEDGHAHQEFYVKPRLGALYSIDKAAKMRAMLESSIQRRFPRGLKVHVHSVDRFGCLAQLTRVLKNADLCITRAKVKTYAVNNSSGHTFYVMAADGSAPDRERVQAACADIGGRLVDPGDEQRATSEGTHRFSFSFLNRQWQAGWRGSPGSLDSGSGSGNLAIKLIDLNPVSSGSI